MSRSLFAIAANTFTETLRQPVYAVVIGATVLVLIASPSLSMFTLDDDNMLLRDVGLSTLLVAGLFLAVFAAATVVSDEIENKTVLTVITKSVPRFVFVIGKFLGVAAAVILAEYLLSLVFMMTLRHGVLQRASDEADMVVIILGSVSTLIVLLVGLGGNYFYNWRFGSVSVYTATLLLSFVMAVLCFVDAHWTFNPAKNNLPAYMVGPILLVIIASLIITAIAVTAALKMNLVATLVLCASFFIAGTSSQYLLAPIAAQGGITGWLAWGGLALAPSINTCIVTNAVYDGTAVPFNYIIYTTLYALGYISAVLLLGIALFRNRQIS